MSRTLVVDPRLLVRWARWVAVNGAFVALIWYGAFADVAWAANLARFLTWFMLITVTVVALALAGDQDEATTDLAEKLSAHPVPPKADFALDFLVAAFMASGGWFVTGPAYLLHGFVMLTARGMSAERAKEPTS